MLNATNQHTCRQFGRAFLGMPRLSALVNSVMTENGSRNVLFKFFRNVSTVEA